MRSETSPRTARRGSFSRVSSYFLETSKCRRSGQVQERAGGLEGLATRVVSARLEGASDGASHAPGQTSPSFFSSQVLPIPRWWQAQDGMS